MCKTKFISLNLLYRLTKVVALNATFFSRQTLALIAGTNSPRQRFRLTKSLRSFNCEHDKADSRQINKH